jgi:hypothetical protein
LTPVRLSQLAVQDIAAARDWFNAREAGLGGKFVERVNETIARIEANPFQYREVIRDARRANLRQFKYSVWFRIKPDHSVVIGCISHRQDLSLARRRALRAVGPG